MDTKLTLKLNKEVILRAKYYARQRNVSLSRMIESYLDSVTKPEVSKEKITPLVDRLSGVIDLSPDFNYKDERAAHLKSKHS